MPVPSYTDISHFRAPYLNAYFSGMGDPSATAPPPGDPGPPPAPPAGEPPAPTLPPVSEMTVTSADGYRRLKPKWQTAAMAVLGSWLTGPQTGSANLDGSPAPGFTVALVRPTPEEIQTAKTNPKAADMLRARTASAFVTRETTTAPKRVVFAEDHVLDAIFRAGTIHPNPLPPGVPLRLYAIGASDPHVESGMKKGGAVLLGGTPGGAPAQKTTGGDNMLAAVGVAAAAVGVVGLVYVTTRKRGQATPSIER